MSLISHQPRSIFEYVHNSLYTLSATNFKGFCEVRNQLRSTNQSHCDVFILVPAQRSTTRENYRLRSRRTYSQGRRRARNRGEEGIVKQKHQKYTRKQQDMSIPLSSISNQENAESSFSHFSELGVARQHHHCAAECSSPTAPVPFLAVIICILFWGTGQATKSSFLQCTAHWPISSSDL